MVQESQPQASPAAVSATDDLSGSRKHSGATIAFITLGVYLLLPTREFYWDGVGFAQTIEASHGSSDHLLHPNHLPYNLMGYAMWKAAAAAGMTMRALFILQALNAPGCERLFQP